MSYKRHAKKCLTKGKKRDTLSKTYKGMSYQRHAKERFIIDMQRNALRKQANEYLIKDVQRNALPNACKATLLQKYSLVVQRMYFREILRMFCRHQNKAYEFIEGGDIG